MMSYYSPHTFEHIQTDNPADWMGRASKPAPDYDPAMESAFWRSEIGEWEVVAAKHALGLTDEQVEAKIEALWQAADRYTSGYISGVAVGILTIGVLQQKPKAMAVTEWSSAIWAEYYARKALVTADSVDNHDFSSFGPMPYSVPELQEEVGL